MLKLIGKQRVAACISRPTHLICESCLCCFVIKNKTYRRRFCSTKCTGVWLSTRVGPAHPHWRGGSVRSDLSRKIIRDIKKRVGHCEQCGATERLHGHHKLPVSTHPDRALDPANIEVLCQKCHEGRHPTIAVLRGSGRSTKIEIACEVCGRPRKINRSEVARTRYCGRACHTAAKRQRQKRAIRCLNDGRAFPSTIEAAAFYGATRRKIRRVLSGTATHTHGLRFAYLDGLGPKVYNRTHPGIGRA